VGGASLEAAGLYPLSRRRRKDGSWGSAPARRINAKGLGYHRSVAAPHRPDDPIPRASRGLARFIPLALLAAILGLRIVYLLQLSRSPLGTFLVEDQLVYQRRAQEILAGHLIGRTAPFYSSALYPYILAAIYAVCGIRPTAVYVVQHLLGVATCALVFLLAREIFEPRRSFVGLVLAGLYAPLVFAEGQILMISWTVFAVALALWSAVRHSRTGSVGSALTCGAAVGLGMADKPNLIVLALAVAAWWRLTAGRWRWSSLVALGAGAALLVAPWVAVNAAATGGRVLISASSGINLAIGNNPLSDGTYTEPWAAQGQDSSQFQGLQNASRYFAGRALGRPVDDLEADRYWRRAALAYILGRPIDEARLLGRKILLMVNRQEIPNVMSFDFYRAQFSALRLFPVGFWLVGPFGLLAALSSPRGGSGARLLLAVLLLYALSLLPFFVCDRFRLPVVPILLVFAADGLATLYETLRARRFRRAARLAAGVGVLAGLVSLPLVRFDPGRDHWMLAQAFLERGDPEKAIDEYRAVLAIRPDQAGAWTDLGLVQSRLGRYTDAEQSLRRATSLSPGLGSAHAALADIHRIRGAVEPALAEYRLAVEADPTLVSAWISLARLLRSDGETELARRTLLKGLSLNPGVESLEAALRDMGGGP
jgi:tetratricopeptide (TPR) repeat protein